MENIERKRLTDLEALVEVRKLLSGFDISEIKNLAKAERDEILLKIKRIEGVTLRQVAHILGVSPSVVFKV